MAQIDSALEYLHYLGRGGKYSVLKFDDIFRSLQSTAIRKGFSNDRLIELIKLWFKIKVPLSKWSSLGYCLIPERKVSEEVVHTIMRLILANFLSEKKFFKVVAALNWLTGLFDYNLISVETLNLYYEFFFSFLQNDKYLISSTKIIYHLTKSQDVKRCKVNNIIELMDKKRSSRHYNCLVAVLCLFKSYKPECVPEEVPNVSINTAFSKLNKSYAERFEQAQIRSNVQLSVTTHDRLVWWTAEGKNNRFTKTNRIHLVPDLEYMQLGALIYTQNGKQRKCFDFTSMHEVLVFHYNQPVEIPANILSLLVNEPGIHILQFSDVQSQERFSHVLYHTLHNNFLHSNPSLSYNEKRHFLRQIAKLQNRLLQGIPVVSRFLSQYVATWNGSDFFDEILELLEWVIFESYDELYDCILEQIESLYLTSDSMYRCSLLNTLGKLYRNIHDIMTTNKKLLFISRSDEMDPVDILNNLFEFIDELSNKTVNTYPDNLIMRHALLSLYENLAQVQLTSHLPLWNLLPSSLAYNVFCSFNGFAINRLLGLILKYISLYDKVKSVQGKGPIKTQISLVEMYSEDFLNCLWHGKAISWRQDGLMLKSLPERVDKYLNCNPNHFDKCFDVTNHFAFTMKYQYRISGFDLDNDKEFVLETVIPQHFNNVCKFIQMARKSSKK